jgi:hypothetical protein
MPNTTNNAGTSLATGIQTISPPLSLPFSSSRALPLPATIKDLWRHWRLCRGNGAVPMAMALDLEQLETRRCLPRYIAHVLPLEDPCYSVLDSRNLRMLTTEPSVDAGKNCPASAPATFDIPALYADWELARTGEVVLRMISMSPFGKISPFARICLPVRHNRRSDADGMVIAIEPASTDLAEYWPATGASSNSDTAGCAETTRQNEHCVRTPSTLPLEVRRQFRERLRESARELRKLAVEYPDADRLGMLLEAARLERMAEGS